MIRVVSEMIPSAATCNHQSVNRAADRQNLGVGYFTFHQPPLQWEGAGPFLLAHGAAGPDIKP